MIKIKLAQKNKDKAPETWEALYERVIEKFIRKKYSISAELAILRQRDSKPEEFAAYNEYAEKCKSEVKAMLGVEEVKYEDTDV